jgi:hypothetical protein
MLYVFIEGRSFRFLMRLLVGIDRQAIVTHLSNQMLLEDDTFWCHRRINWNRCDEDLFRNRELGTTCLKFFIYSRTTSVIMSRRKDM